MKTLFTFLILVSSLTVYSANNKNDVLVHNINKDLSQLYKFSETMNTKQSFDPDSLSYVIAEKIIDYIQETGFENFDAALFPGLEIAYRESNAPFWVLTYSYYGGDNDGLIPNSIIIQQTENGYIYYNMIRYEAAFFAFYQLIGDTYLCFATTPEGDRCANNEVFAFNFQGQAIPAPVFNDSSSFSICNSDLSFNQQTQILTINVNNIPSYDEGLDYNAYFEKKGLNFFKVTNYNIVDNTFIGTLVTLFNGSKFVQP